MYRTLRRAKWFLGGCVAAYGIALMVAGGLAWKLGAILMDENVWEDS